MQHNGPGFEEPISNGLKIVVFGDKATSLAVAKGNRVYCEGRLKLESWTSKDGKERSSLKRLESRAPR